MEARRRVEFTGVELAGGAELAALVEKAVAGHSGGGGPHAGEGCEAEWGVRRRWSAARRGTQCGSTGLGSCVVQDVDARMGGGASGWRLGRAA